MAWTINGVSPESAGIHVAEVEVGTGMTDRAVLESTDSWSYSAWPAFGDWISISADGTTVLYGMVTSREPYAQAGGVQGYRWEISGPWWHLQRTPYTQPFYYATSATAKTALPRSKCWVGMDPATGERCNTLQAVNIILAAAVAAGVPISTSVSFTGVDAPPFEVTDVMCADALQSVMRWHPGLSLFWRYTGSSATLHIKSSLGSATLPVTDNGVVSNVPQMARSQRRDDQVPLGVVIRYERVNIFEFPGGDPSNTIQRIEAHTDSAGLSSTPGPGVLFYTVELRGSQSQFAEATIVTRTVPDDVDEDPGATARAKILKWYQRHIPALEALPAAALRVDEHTTAMDLPKWNTDDSQRPSEWDEEDAIREFDEAAETSDFPRELVEGTLPEWAPFLQAEPMVARIVVGWTGEGSPTEEQQALAAELFGADFTEKRSFDVQYTGTNARSKRYKGLAKFTAAEPWPENGLAAAVYDSLANRGYQGEVSVVGQSSFTSLLPGAVVTLSGGATGNGIIQHVKWSAATRRTSLQFGSPGHLMVPDLIELARANRLNALTANYNKDRQQEAGPGSGNAITGSVRSPRSNTIPVNVSGEGNHPYKLRTVATGASTWDVFIWPGSLNGLPVTFEGTELDAATPPSISYSGTSLKRIWLKIETVLTVEDDMVISHTPVVGTIGHGLELPENAPTGEAAFYVQIGTVQAGAVVAQTVRHSLWASFCDAGSAAVNLNISQA